VELRVRVLDDLKDGLKRDLIYLLNYLEVFLSCGLLTKVQVKILGLQGIFGAL